MKLQHSTARNLILMCFISLYFQHTVTADEIEKTGNILKVVIPMIGLGSTLFYEDGNKGAVQFSNSLVVTQITTELLKIATHKRRPNGGCCKSFPSGHASAAFMGAAFIHKRYGWHYSIPAYLGATYVGYSRVHANKHYVEDVVAGAALGILGTFYFTEPYKDFAITPLTNDGTYGLNITRQW